jgi:hypothetical protein
MLLTAVLPASAEPAANPLAAAGTESVVTRTVTREENRDPPMFTEREIFLRKPAEGTKLYGNPSVPRPSHMAYEMPGNWSGTFDRGRVSFASNTDVIFTDGEGGEIRIDIRRTIDVESIHIINAGLFEIASKAGKKPADLYPPEDARAAFVYKEGKRRNARQVFYSVMRLPQQPQDYTVVIRAEWPYAKRFKMRGQFNRILQSLTFE